MQKENQGGWTTSTLLAWALCVLPLCTETFAAWEKIAPHPGGNVSEFLVAGNRKFILTAAGVHVRDPGQASWSLLDLPCKSHVDELHSSGNAILANSYEGKPCLSRDGGKTWKALDSGPIKPSPGVPVLGMVRHFGPQGLYVVALDTDFVLFRSPDTGRTWIRLRPAPDILSLVPTGADFLLSNQDGGVYRMDPVTGQLTSASEGLAPTQSHSYQIIGRDPGIILASTGEEGKGIYRYLRSSNRWELLIPEFVQFFPLTANDGSRVFLLVSDKSGSTKLWHSTDGGGSWQQKVFTGDAPSRIWAEADTLIYGYWGVPLVRREWGSQTEVIWDQGIYANLIHQLRLYGKTLYIDGDNFPGYRRTRDRGKTWEAPMDSTIYEHLHITGNQVYVSGAGYLDRLDPVGLGRHKMPFPTLEQPIYKLMDAGDYFYAISSLPLEPRKWLPVLYSASKSKLTWGDSRELPFPNVITIAAASETLAATYGDSLAFSKDGGKTWSRISPPLPRRANSDPQNGSKNYHVHWEAGLWTLWDGVELFHATDPEGVWSRMQAPLDTILNYRISGTRVLVDNYKDAFHLSSDQGRTWQAVPLPMLRTQIFDFALSDSMVCVTGYTNTQCQELDPLPVVAVAQKARISKDYPPFLRRSGRFVIRNPHYPHRNAFLKVDGRALALPRP